MKAFKNKTKLSVWKFLSLGYLTVILIGSVLLILPCATAKGARTTYLNALFTSASATCVTGLVPYDTGTHWSLFGQIVLLCLIQTGGLGFMTFVSVIVNTAKHRWGLYGRKLFMQSSGEGKLSGIRKLTKRIIVGTVIFEGLGAILLSIRFIPDFGAARGIYYAVWHSVSAFCNAGFDLMGGRFGGETFVSFVHYVSDPLVTLTLAFLIIIGGLGFCVWGDVIDCRFNIKKFQLHTKVVLFVNALILVIPTFLFFLFEKNNVAFAEFSTPTKWLIAFFNSVSPRTAGFNTVDLSRLTDSSYLLMLMLMFVGGSSGSTAGGIKITTFAVIIMGMVATFRGKKDINVGKRRMDGNLVNQALAIFTSCLFVAIAATLSICAIETSSEITFKQVLFECISAIGTVGLSLSLTPILSTASKFIIILLMYTGRVGILTLALAVAEKRTAAETRRPLDTMLIG